MKWRKAEGSDGVVVEMVEAAGEFAINKITSLTKSGYNTGQVPENMKESEFIVIPMKNGAVECNKHVTKAGNKVEGKGGEGTETRHLC